MLHEACSFVVKCSLWLFLRGLAGAKIDTLPISCLSPPWPQRSPLPCGQAGAPLWFPLAPGVQCSGHTAISMLPLTESCQLARSGCPREPDPQGPGAGVCSATGKRGVPVPAADLPATSCSGLPSQARRTRAHHQETGRKDAGQRRSHVCGEFSSSPPSITYISPPPPSYLVQTRAPKNKRNLKENPEPRPWVGMLISHSNKCSSKRMEGWREGGWAWSVVSARPKLHAKAYVCFCLPHSGPF